MATLVDLPRVALVDGVSTAAPSGERVSLTFGVFFPEARFFCFALLYYKEQLFLH